MSNNYPLNPQADRARALQSQFHYRRPIRRCERTALQADFRVVSPDYLNTLQLPPIKGRFITEADHMKAARVAVVNQTLARHRWGNEDPVDGASAMTTVRIGSRL
ncbi:MAG: hypothetical protein U0Y68_23440 [Blastocatellia bacterium]